MISGAGWASATGTSGYQVHARNVISQRVGLLAWTVSGRAANPFGGGTMCLATPLRRTWPRSSNGSLAGNDCTGSWSIDMNEHLSTTIPLSAGTTIQCQWVGRDPGFAPPDNYQLSDALEFMLNP